MSLSPQSWRLIRERSDAHRRLLVRAWWLFVVLILAVAAAFHALGSDVFPRIFAIAVALGAACWLLAVLWAQGAYLLVSYFAQRSERREADQPHADRLKGT